MLGATLALLRPNRREPASVLTVDALLAIGLMLIAIPVFVYDERDARFPASRHLCRVVGTALIIWVGDCRSRVGRLLDNGAMVFVGQLSYSMYLWHWPILVFFAMLSRRPFGSFTAGQILLVIAMTISLSWLSFVFVENPIRRRRVLISRPLLFGAMGTSAAVLAAYGLSAYLDQGFEYRVSKAALQIADGAHDRVREWRCKDMPLAKVNATDLCRLGEPKQGAPAKFILWGDSHAHVLFPAVDEAAKETHVVGLLASLHSCPPVPGIEVASEWAVDCYAFNQRVEQLIATEHYDAIILAAHWAAYERPGTVRAIDGSAEGTSKHCSNPICTI